MVMCFAFWLLLLIGCAGSSVYVEPGEVSQMDDKFSSTDLNMMANSMYNSIMGSLGNIQQGDESRMVVALLEIENLTSEHIDTDNISDKLQIALLKSGSLRFVDRTRIDQITQEFSLGSSGLLDANTVKSAGSVLGADYFLYGSLSAIVKTGRSQRVTWYRLSMRMLTIETNEIIWADEFEISKKSKKGILDW